MAPLAEGARLCGRYTLIRRLGRGGMAEVWLADDAGEGRRVALKCLLPEFAAQPGMLRLFEQEARRVAQLAHPHIVRLYAFHGAAAPPCLAMEAIDGGDLRAARGRPAAELAALLAPVADALFHVHALGLVHRDLKPSNILLAADGRPCLTDFGVAAALEAAPGEWRTAGGGSDEFASPEQLAGQPPAISDDAWAFGRLIEALLAPADRNGALAALAAQLTAASPAARPADFGALRDRLQALAGGDSAGGYLAGETLDIRRPAGLLRAVADGPPARMRPDQGPRWVWPGLALLLVLLAAVVFLLPDWAAERRATAPPAERRAPVDRAATDTAADEIRRLVDARRAAEALRGELEPALAGLRARAVERWAAGDFAALESAYQRGEDHWSRRDYAGAAAAWEQALEDARSLEERRGGIVAAALAQGGAALEAGQSGAAAEAFGLASAADPGNPAALRGLERAAVLDQLLEALSVGAAAEREGRLEAARDAYAGAVRLDRDHPDAAAALARVAAIQAEQRARAEAARRAQAVARLADAARAAAAREEREAAIQHWRGVLAEQEGEPSARAGLAKATARAELAGRLEEFLADPLRLTEEAVFAAAQAILVEARAAPAPAVVLSARTAMLEDALELAVRPVAVIFESDDRTEVLLHRVGRLGTFQRRAVELKPGRYTATGSRPGYRDVRREFTVEPGRPMSAPVVIRSEEPI